MMGYPCLSVSLKIYLLEFDHGLEKFIVERYPKSVIIGPSGQMLREGASLKVIIRYDTKFFNKGFWKQKRKRAEKTSALG
jgi:hypothetical protein